MRPGNPPSGMPAFGGEVDYEELEKYNAKQDKKLRKIIGDENFGCEYGEYEPPEKS